MVLEIYYDNHDYVLCGSDLAVVVEVVPDEEISDCHPHLLVCPFHAAIPTVSAIIISITNMTMIYFRAIRVGLYNKPSKH